MGEARNAIDIYSRLARRMGFAMPYRGPAQVMDEISKLVPAYRGITYARLERNGMQAPVRSHGDPDSPVLTIADEGAMALRPAPIMTASA
mgnify:FL=1